MKNIVATLKQPKYLALGGFFVLLLILPLIMLAVSTQQNLKPKAGNVGVYEDSCHNLQITFEETPQACVTNTSQAGMTSHSSKAIVKLKDGVNLGGKKITLDWRSRSYWCATPATFVNNSCLDNEKPDEGECTITNDNTTCIFAAKTQSPVGQYAGQTCGYYQDDFAFNYTGDSFGGSGCHWGSYKNPGPEPGGATFCNGGPCKLTTPTPTIGITNTPTPTQEITPTPTDTITLTPTPTTGITVTPTNTPTVTPTGTLTPTATPTVTTTPGPTSTPGPSATPTTTPGPTTTPKPTVPVTPRPTLPPTGPVENVIGIGLVGAAIAVLGALIVFGL